MANAQTSIKHMGNEHNDWLRGLGFYKDELAILKDRLTEIAGKNTGKEVAVFTEHYENQIKLQSITVDTIRHNINEVVKAIANQTQQGVGYIDETLLAEHDKLREKYVVEETMINSLRHEFNKFAAQWL